MFRSLVAVFVAACGVLFVQAFAFGMSVLPTTIDVRVETGESSSAPIVVANDKDVPDIYILSMRSVTFADDGSLLFASTSPSWLSLSEQQLEVSPHDAVHVTLTAAPSAEVAAGSYVVAILVQPAAPSTGGIALTAAYSSLAFITVGAPPSPLARCNETGLGQSSNRNIALAVDVENSGGGILYVEASLEASSAFGDRSLVADNGALHRVIAGQSRALTWQVAMPWWMFGTVTFTPSGLPCGSVTTFVFPSVSLMSAALVLVLVLLVPLLLWRVRRG